MADRRFESPLFVIEALAASGVTVASTLAKEELNTRTQGAELLKVGADARTILEGLMCANQLWSLRAVEAMDSASVTTHLAHLFGDLETETEVFQGLAALFMATMLVAQASRGCGHE